MNGHWIAVAAAEHVRRGLSGGFMQVCHGKGAPLRRIKPGDHVVYYSPTATFGGLDRLQAFTAIGTVREREPYRVDMGDGFQPFRRDVDWLEAQEAQIRPLLDRLHLTVGQRNWGYQFRFGLLRAEAHDFEIIASAMSAHAVSAVLL
jgi:hypothetical protein